jgi:hypothetical protein
MSHPNSDGPQGIPLRLDTGAESADPSLPAFLARPANAPVYHGFPILEESRTADGWCFGTITDFDERGGSEFGDAFVVAPDNTRAGIIWQVGPPNLEVCKPPDENRWGVFNVWVARAVRQTSDLVGQLQVWLPELRRRHMEWATKGS